MSTSDNVSNISCRHCNGTVDSETFVCADCGRLHGEDIDQTCGNCGVTIDEGDLFCRSCGHSIQSGTEKKCEYCDALLYSEAQFCHSCGANTAEHDACKLLGIEMTDDMISEYIFKGHIAHTVSIGKANIIVRTINMKERDEINKVVDARFISNTTEISQRSYTEYSDMVEASKCIVSIGDVKINSIEDIEKMGYEIVLIALTKARLLQTAFMQAVQRGQVANF